MSLAVLRTADAWWVRTPRGAAHIDTDATTTGELLAEPEKIEAAQRSGSPSIRPRSTSLP